jgi:hypothetical protein
MDLKNLKRAPAGMLMYQVKAPSYLYLSKEGAASIIDYIIVLFIKIPHYFHTKIIIISKYNGTT